MARGSDEKPCGGAGPGAAQSGQADGAGGYGEDDGLAEAAESAAGKLGAPSQLPRCDADGVADNVTAAGTKRGHLGTKAAAV
jgi:hypothetical protein